MIEIIEFPQSAGLNHIELTADIVTAYVSSNHVQATDLPALIAGIHVAIVDLSRGSASAAPAAEKLTPARIKKSITHDALISFVDGKPYKTLKRHLSVHGLTIETYRERYGLPQDYPATAAGYSAKRSALAKSLGLGQLRRKEAPSEPELVAEKPKRAGRPRQAKEYAEA